RRLVSYEVEPNERVKAWLLIPKGAKGRLPAVLCRHQTVLSAKDEPIGLRVHVRTVDKKPMYVAIADGREMSEGNHYALKYAMRGFVTLTPDELTAGDRVEPPGPFDTNEFYKRHPRWSAIGKAVWDGMRAIDYLQSLEFVDGDKIAVTGHSLGGVGTVWLTAM